MSGARRSLILLAGMGLLASAGRAEGVAVRVLEARGGVYELEGRFTASASRSEAWKVLSDYDRIDEFVPSVTESRMVHRGAERAVIEQKLAGRIFMFSRQVDLTLEVEETPENRISFRDVARRDFWSYAGEWTLADADGGTDVRYRLRASPRFHVPDFVERPAFKRGVRNLLDEVRREILRRADGGGGS